MALLAFHTIILGIIEGLTEFIPVSSTAHLLLAGRAITMPEPFLEVLSISIQSGAILASVWYFFGTVWSNRSLIPKVVVGFIPTGIAGVLLYPLIKPLFASTFVIALALILGGIILIVLKPRDTDEAVERITYMQAFLIGIAQIFAFIPGISRAGATLIGGTMLRIPRQVIVAFSFLLAVPTILGASVVELRHAPALSNTEWQLIALGCAVAFLVALLTIQFFITVLTKKPLALFGWYRIGLGLLVLFLL